MKLTEAMGLEDPATTRPGTELNDADLAASTLQALERWLAMQAAPDPDSPGSWWRFFAAVARHRRAGRLSLEGLSTLRARAEVAMGPETLQGRVFALAHSSAPAFAVLDDIQQRRLSDELLWRAWDAFFHVQPLAEALHYRPLQLQRVLCDLMQWMGGQHLKVLVVGVGAGREVQGFLETFPEAPVEFTCVDEDAAALAHAKDLSHAWNNNRVRMQRASLRQLVLPERYDLVWAMGLFDTLDDGAFLPLLGRLQSLAKPNMGHVVFDHLSLTGPSLAYLDWLDWPARTRSTAELSGLMRVAGLSEVAIDFEPSPGGASQFVRLTCGF